MAEETLTAEWAESVELPSLLHPIERVREIGRLASEISSMNNVGWFPGNQTVFTRTGLVRRAEARQKAEEWNQALNEAKRIGENNG